MGRVVCIVGPTASGKTATSQLAAERLGAEILSCDSVAVYRGLEIGAAKPTALERARVPHHLLDVVEPDERFSAARWAALADAAAQAVWDRGKAVLCVGGSGLYLRAWLEGLAPTPAPDPAIRARHEATPLSDLYQALERVDPTCAAAISRNDRVRIGRALEVFEQTGVPMSEWRKRHEAPPRHEALLLGIDPPRAELYARIDARVIAMMAAGLCEETSRLRKRFGDDAPALRSLGYRELCAHLRGETSLEEATLRIQRESRRYARRQLVWFRGQAQVLWYPSGSALDLEHARRFLE